MAIKNLEWRNFPFMELCCIFNFLLLLCFLCCSYWASNRNWMYHQMFICRPGDVMNFLLVRMASRTQLPILPFSCEIWFYLIVTLCSFSKCTRSLTLIHYFISYIGQERSFIFYFSNYNNKNANIFTVGKLLKKINRKIFIETLVHVSNNKRRYM